MLIKFLIALNFLFLTPETDWTSKLSKEIMGLEAETEGEVGLYIKNLSDGREFVHNGNENWYFASTIKIPLAIAVLKEVENGEISLDDELILQESDYVDGSGDLLGMPPGTRLSIRELIQQMVWHSDNSATDMLIRLIGEKEFNDFVQKYLDASGINYITTILQVRYDAYSEFHDYAANLKSTDIVFINSTPSRKERVMRLTGKMSVDPSDLRVASIEEAFEKYYLRELNSGKTESMGKMLEQLYYGELLSAEHTSFLLETMTNITTGDRRIKAGLPTGTQFAQKTGTQIRRAVNMGIIFPNDKKMEPIIVVACVRGINNPQKAEKIFKNIGILLSDTFLE